MPDHHLDRHPGKAIRNLNRPAEKLVLDGYRIWSSGLAGGGHQPVDELNALYSGLLGTPTFRPAALALMEFVGTLGLCARCPLHMMAVSSNQVCRDEVLIVGLVAGIQNGDDEAVELCLGQLTCETRCERVALAAGTLAFVLKGYGKTLLPLPASAITEELNAHRQKRTSLSGRHGLAQQARAKTYH